MMSEKSGLPSGWGWGDCHPFAYRREHGADLCSDVDPEDERATVYTNGAWIVWAKGTAEILAEGNVAQSGETRSWAALLAAAQREAEAALWRCDGFGVGEARGVRLTTLDISDAAALVATRRTVTLPGLSGWWIVRAARCDGGSDGVEVDAVRVEAEPAPLPCPGGAEEHNRAMLAGHRCAACGVARQDAKDAAPWRWVPTTHRLPSGTETVMLGSLARAEPAPREPSAPAAGEELARLLPGLAEDIERVRSMLGREVSMARRMRLARACELLLAERERVGDVIRGATALRNVLGDRAEAAEREAVALRARVAELEAAAAKFSAQDRTILAGLRALEEQIEPHSLDGESAEATLKRLLASPPPGTVAALVAKVEAAAESEHKRGEMYLSGDPVGDGHDAARDAYREAASLIRSTLAAPSPLDRAVAEVVALPASSAIPPAVVTIGDHAMVLSDIAHEVRSDREGARAAFCKACRVALAGMLACDAGGEKEPAR